MPALRSRADASPALLLALATAAVALASGLVGCASITTWRPTIGASYVVAQDFEAELSALGYTATFDVDYESIEGVLAATGYEAEGGRKMARAELRIGSAAFEDEDGDEIDAIEIAVGGRGYLGGGRFSPYLALHAVATITDEFEGVDLGTQYGARLGGGIEFDLGDHVFFDLGLDYTLPIIEAEDDEFGILDTEVEGFALRVGVGVRL